MRKAMLAILLVVTLALQIAAQTTPGAAVQLHQFNDFTTSAKAQSFNLIGTGNLYHQVTYNVIGTASPVSVVIEASKNNGTTYSTIATLTDTGGTSSSFSGSYNLIRITPTWTDTAAINPAYLTATYAGSPTVTAKITGGGTSGQVAYFDGIGSITGNAAMSFATTTGLTLTLPLVSTQGTIVDSTPFISHTATWNDAADAFIDDNRAITSTASAATSAISRVQVGGSTVYRWRKDGSYSDTDTFAQAGINLTQGRYVASSDGGGSVRFLTTNNATGGLIFSSGGTQTSNSGAQHSAFAFNPGSYTSGAGSAVFTGIDERYTINFGAAQSGSVTGIFVNATETALNSVIHNLMDLQVGAASKFKVDNAGNAQAQRHDTLTNCADSAGAAACGSASSGAFVIDATTTATVVSTTAITANSQVLLTEDSSLGTRLGITCNTQSILILGTPVVTARTTGASFTATIVVGPTTSPMCINYTIVN